MEPSFPVLGLFWNAVIFIWFPIIIYYFYLKLRNGDNFSGEKAMKSFAAMIVFYYMFYLIGWLFVLYKYISIKSIKTAFEVVIYGFLMISASILYFIYDDGNWLNVFGVGYDVDWADTFNQGAGRKKRMRRQYK